MEILLQLKKISKDPKNEDEFTNFLLPLTAKQSTLIAKPDKERKKAARAPEIALKINVDEF